MFAPVQRFLYGFIPRCRFLNELRAGCRGRQSIVRPRKSGGAVQLFHPCPVLAVQGQLYHQGLVPELLCQEDLGDHAAHNGNACHQLGHPQANGGHQHQTVGAQCFDPEAARAVPDHIPQGDVAVESALFDVAEQQEEDVAEYDPTEGGIHRYEFVVEDVTWEQAFENCQSKGGYLARINSEEEYQYILNELNSQQLQNVQFFIGGRRDTDSEAYYWVDENNMPYGEQINVDSYWAANEWLDGEPSFRDGDIEEQYLDLLYHKNSERWTWNDAPNDILSVVPEFSGRIGYICEYED